MACRCGGLLDVCYDWDRARPPDDWSFFEQKWSRRFEPLSLSPPEIEALLPNRCSQADSEMTATGCAPFASSSAFSNRPRSGVAPSSGKRSDVTFATCRAVASLRPVIAQCSMAVAKASPPPPAATKTIATRSLASGRRAHVGASNPCQPRGLTGQIAATTELENLAIVGATIESEGTIRPMALANLIQMGFS